MEEHVDIKRSQGYRCFYHSFRNQEMIWLCQNADRIGENSLGKSAFTAIRVYCDPRLFVLRRSTHTPVRPATDVTTFMHNNVSTEALIAELYLRTCWLADERGNRRRRGEIQQDSRLNEGRAERLPCEAHGRRARGHAQNGPGQQLSRSFLHVFHLAL